MPIEYKRSETVYINETTRRTCSSVQWLLENIPPTHPISDNNALKVFICGQEAFQDIAAQIDAAKESIDICCWGFDPGMELVRNGSGKWPRGPTYGDLLVAATKRGVTVRLLCWYDGLATQSQTDNPCNMPGYSHDRSARDIPTTTAAIDKYNAETQLKKTQAALGGGTFLAEPIELVARRAYCATWFALAFNGSFTGKSGHLEIRTRSGDRNAITKSSASETQMPDEWFNKERIGMVHFGTHHQKPLLIDFYHQEGAKAVGYVMGLNSLTDYWDTAEHKYENFKRERPQFNNIKPSPFATIEPYRDYACRIERGGALVAIYNNFIKAWERANPKKVAGAKSELGSRGVPATFLKRATAGGPQVQIVRTQPDEDDKTIKAAYLMAAEKATNAVGYLYLENQYFQWEEWTQHLLKVRKKVMNGWDAGCGKIGLKGEDMPVMHLFIVIPTPERNEMIPRTYDTLATLGQQGHMAGQEKMIKNANEQPQHRYAVTGLGPPVDLGVSVPDVIAHANSIVKPNAKTLETQFGIKVCTAMLNTCGSDGKQFNFREIYIHSKLLLIDDTFFTLGSANLNLRSMAVDSEINVATVDPVCATDLRKRIWGQLSGNQPDCDGGDGSREKIAKAFRKWVKLMDKNEAKKDKNMRMTGFLLPLKVEDSSTKRLG